MGNDNPWTTSDGSDTQLMQLYKIGADGKGRNPIQETQYQQLLQQYGLPSNASPATTPTISSYKAQQGYQAGLGSAVSGLQAQGTSLDAQYENLKNAVLGQGTVAMNTVTTGENNLLAQRGITNNSPLYAQQMGSAQLPVQVANQNAVGSLGYTQAQLKSQLAEAISGLQAGGAGTLAMLPLQFGSLALAQAANLANIQLAQAQAKAISLQAPYMSSLYGPYNINTGNFVANNLANLFKGASLSTVNGQVGFYIP